MSAYGAGVKAVSGSDAVDHLCSVVFSMAEVDAKAGWAGGSYLSKNMS